MTSKPSPHIERVFDVIVWTKKCAAWDIGRKLRLSSATVGRCITELLAAKRIKEIGCAFDAYRDDLYRQTSIYALPGTPMLPRRVRMKRAPKDKTRKPINAAGSGVVAGHRYVAPIKELRRDPRDAYPGIQR